MYQQDYFIRVILEFFKALSRALAHQDMNKKNEAIHDLYRQYLGSYEFYQNATTEEAIEQITTLYPEEQQYQRMEMLAELYYAEAEYRPQPIGETLLERALPLFELVDRHSGTYSLGRLEKIQSIHRRIHSGPDSQEEK